MGIKVEAHMRIIFFLNVRDGENCLSSHFLTKSDVRRSVVLFLVRNFNFRLIGKLKC